MAPGPHDVVLRGVHPQAARPGYGSPDDRFAFLFNSYYMQAGPRHARDKRGLVSRPGGEAVRDYRAMSTTALARSAERAARRRRRDRARWSSSAAITRCSIRNCWSPTSCTGFFNPLLPAYRDPEPLPVTVEVPLTFTRHEGGLIEIGHDGEGFAYDCEGPRHRTWLDPFEIADRPVTNRDWIAFMEDGGYGDPRSG